MTLGASAWLVGLVSAAAVATMPLQPAPAARSGFDPTTLDRAVRPQDDLYRYANNRWVASTAIAADRSKEDATTELFDRVEQDIHAIILKLAAGPRPRPGSPWQQVVDFYASMVNEREIEARGVSPLKPQLDAIDAIASVTALADRAGVLTATTIAGPFFGSLAPDPQNPAARVVQVSQGGLLLEHDDYLKDDDRSRAIRAHYRAYLEQIFVLVGRATAPADAAAVLDLEIAIARTHAIGTPANPVVPRALTVARMNTEMPGFDWTAWAHPQGIDRSATILVAQPSFFGAFAAMVPTVPLSTWRAWLAGRYITAMAPSVTDALGDARFEFFGRFLAGQQAPRPRWKRGVSTVNVFLGDTVGRLYVDAHFPRGSKGRVERIANQVIQVYREVVSSFDWPTGSAKVAAQSAVARVAARVGYPDVWRDYRGLAIAADDLFGNVMRAQKFDNDRRMAQGGRAAAGGEWPLSPQTVNAFYNPGTGEVILPAAILQPPYFDADADDAVNYGAIGAVVGHELGHALDDVGRRIPAGFTVESFNDLVGLVVARRAWERSLDGKAAPVLDGLTADQRFFLGWARIWREKVQPEFARQLAVSGPYPTGDARANRAVSHLDAFYAAFDVKPGDALFIPAANRLCIGRCRQE
jgi:putative endopeptidase